MKTIHTLEIIGALLGVAAAILFPLGAVALAVPLGIAAAVTRLFVVLLRRL